MQDIHRGLALECFSLYTRTVFYFLFLTMPVSSLTDMPFKFKVHTLLVSIAITAAMVTSTGGTLTSSEERELLTAHNYFRSHVYPQASNMLKLVSPTSIHGSSTSILLHIKLVSPTSIHIKLVSQTSIYTCQTG